MFTGKVFIFRNKNETVPGGRGNNLQLRQNPTHHEATQQRNTEPAAATEKVNRPLSSCTHALARTHGSSQQACHLLLLLVVGCWLLVVVSDASIQRDVYGNNMGAVIVQDSTPPGGVRKNATMA